MDVAIGIPFRGPLRRVGPLVIRWYRGQCEPGLANLTVLMESGSI